jgi:ATP-dependent Lhr-like helicase
MALALQERGIGITDWFDWVESVPAFAMTPPEERAQIVKWMLEKEILAEDGGLLWFGRQGEENFGRKNFLEILSVFTSPPVFLVTYGKQELGFIDERALYTSGANGIGTLLLAGQIWSVVSIDWKRRRVFAQPSTDAGAAPWRGQPVLLSFDLCQALKRLYQSNAMSECWSRRASARIQVIRESMPYLGEASGTCLVRSKYGLAWWTFAGGRANQMIASYLRGRISPAVSSDSLVIRIGAQGDSSQVLSAIERLNPEEVLDYTMEFSDSVMKGLKFSEALPRELGCFVLSARLSDASAVEKVLRSTMTYVED